MQCISENMCAERIKTVAESVVRGALQHELAHAILHGRAEFYTFRFSRQFVSAAEASGFDVQSLQQFVYLLSIALKDEDVVRRLADTGFQSGQIALLEHMLADTHSEKAVWRAIRHLAPRRKMAVASFLKTLLPIMSLAALQIDAGRRLRQKWQNTYDWLAEAERRAMMRFAAAAARDTDGTFQERLAQTALKLISDPEL